MYAVSQHDRDIEFVLQWAKRRYAAAQATRNATPVAPKVTLEPSAQEVINAEADISGAGDLVNALTDATLAS